MKNQNLGKKAKDKITGFSGVITGFCQYLTGCDQYLIIPKASDGKYPDGSWLDSNRIEIEKEVSVVIDTSSENGPDKPALMY
ncbi:MAG: hypothetical protein GY760_13955 [Deltaproteobacteria bacterium]|nr:hypothetical protein [Deltaproteobacteria bacterium]